MDWFRRRRQNDDMGQRREGTLIDLDRYILQITGGVRPGLPQDGRYWAMMATTYSDGETRLLWERAGSYDEVTQLLQAFRVSSRTKPRRLNNDHITDVDGVWGAQQRGNQLAVLSIWHPLVIGAGEGDLEWILNMAVLDSKESQADIEANDPLYWTGKKPVPLERYAELLQEALSCVASYRVPGEIANDMGLYKRDVRTVEDGERWLALVGNEELRVKTALHRLAEIRPQPDALLQLHALAIGYIREFLVMVDLVGMGLLHGVQGDKQERNRFYAESEARAADWRRAQERLAGELQHLSTNQRPLIAALNLPTWQRLVPTDSLGVRALDQDRGPSTQTAIPGKLTAKIPPVEEPMPGMMSLARCPDCGGQGYVEFVVEDQSETAIFGCTLCAGIGTIKRAVR